MAYIANELGISIEEVSPEAKFVEDLGADSLSVSCICVGIEQDFGIYIGDREIEGLETVSELIDLVKQKIK